MRELAAQIHEYMAVESPDDAFIVYDEADLNSDEKVAVWSLLNSKARAAIKRIGDSKKIQLKEAA